MDHNVHPVIYITPLELAEPDDADSESRKACELGRIMSSFPFLRTIIDSRSISDHMYRMAILAMCCSDTQLDISKSVPFAKIQNSLLSFDCRCVMMCLVHDLAEAQG